jgi:hypothetical protein
VTKAAQEPEEVIERRHVDVHANGAERQDALAGDLVGHAIDAVHFLERAPAHFQLFVREARPLEQHCRGDQVAGRQD